MKREYYKFLDGFQLIICKYLFFKVVNRYMCLKLICMGHFLDLFVVNVENDCLKVILFPKKIEI